MTTGRLPSLHLAWIHLLETYSVPLAIRHLEHNQASRGSFHWVTYRIQRNSERNPTRFYYMQLSRG